MNELVQDDILPLEELYFNENNSKFELKPYSITFVSNINMNTSSSVYNDVNLKIYPNPSSEIINIIGGYSQYVIRSIDGNTILRDSKASINTSNFSKGIYFISFKLLDQIITKKIIIK